jgi:hypothetical protein
MEVIELVNKLVAEFPPLIHLQSSGVIGVSRSEDCWIVTIEMLEKKSIPDSMDVLGCYEVKLDIDGNIQDFARVSLRRRGDTAAE